MSSQDFFYAFLFQLVEIRSLSHVAETTDNHPYDYKMHSFIHFCTLPKMDATDKQKEPLD